MFQLDHPPSDASIWSLAALPKSSCREAMTVVRPARLNSLAISKPIPLFDPVTMATDSELHHVSDELAIRYRVKNNGRALETRAFLKYLHSVRKFDLVYGIIFFSDTRDIDLWVYLI